MTKRVDIGVNVRHARYMATNNTDSIKSIRTEGSGIHLTATDKRNIRAVMNAERFTLGVEYQVNGRKRYIIDPVVNDYYQVTVLVNRGSDFGGTYTDRGRITIKVER